MAKIAERRIRCALFEIAHSIIRSGDRRSRWHHSILTESMLLALPGALLGAAIAWLLFNGNSVNSGAFLFKLSVTPYLLVVGIGWGLLIGLIGGSLPARLPIATALRAS